MRNPIKIIHGAVERIDYPLMVARLIADDTFLAVKSMARKFLQQQISNDLLAFDVDRQLNVVSFGGIDPAGQIEILTQKLARGACRLIGGLQVMPHSKK